MSSLCLLFTLLNVIFCILTLSVNGQSANDSTTNESYFIIGYTVPFQCNLINVVNPPPMDSPLRGRIRVWPEEYSKLDNASWIAYVNCDVPQSTMSYIYSAQGNHSSAIVLYSNSNDSCDTSSINIRYMSAPLFLGTNKTCQDSILTNESLGLFAFIEFVVDNNNSSYPNNSTDINGSTVIAATYQTAMVILYSVSGIVLGLFFIIVVVNIIKNRLRPSSQSAGEGNSNSGNGIAKSVLDSFPVYLFSLGNNGGDKTSEDAKTGDASDEPVLESLKVIDEKTLESTEEIKLSDQTPSENKEEEVDVTIDGSADDAVDVSNNHQTKDSQLNRTTLLPSAISSVFNKVTDEQLTCPICLGDFESGEELRILPCHHQYHTVCIDPWLLNTSPLCPMCKTDYTSWDKELPSSHQEEGSISSSLYSGGIASDEQPQTRINNSNDSSHMLEVKECQGDSGHKKMTILPMTMQPG
ncbi:7211_t:CDS:2 [Acaulospora colombiana]|uniref:7211_t:CDS:1 n=1 Tax=Acaulospora colombiana TaxID=27376 RepID=A0ACA9K0H4_9GLOM|nr:7211_t:CDS:2 [Acaulospora colombiana]